MILTRRKLIGGLGLLVAAPAIVRASSIMPVKVMTREEQMAALLQSIEKTLHAVYEKAWEDMMIYGVTGMHIATDGSVHHVPAVRMLLAPTAAGESAA